MLAKIESLKKQGAKIGYTCSTFDMLHAGHVAMLAEAKANCDYLVVGLLNDPTVDRPDTKNQPIQTMFERWVQVQGLEYVDCVIPFTTEQDIIDMLLTIRPHIRFLGVEYKDKEFTGSHLDFIELYYNDRKHSFSTSELRDRVSQSRKRPNRL